MSVVLTTLDDGPAVEIEAANGEVKTYRLRIKADAAGWSCTLQDGDGPVYAVRCLHGRLWSCTCKAWEFNANRWTDGCKHTRTGKELREFLEAMGS